eukprot:13203168-Alexandrium_andersonii.AAC.1
MDARGFSLAQYKREGGSRKRIRTFAAAYEFPTSGAWRVGHGAWARAPRRDQAGQVAISAQAFARAKRERLACSTSTRAPSSHCLPQYYGIGVHWPIYFGLAP